MSDELAIYLLVVLVGLVDGWLTLTYGVLIAVRLFKLRMTWNRVLGLLLILTAGLSAVIYTAVNAMPKLTAPFAFLPTVFVGSAFASGLGLVISLVYRSANRRERTSEDA